MVLAHYSPYLIDKFLTFMELAKLVTANSNEILKYSTQYPYKIAQS